MTKKGTGNDKKKKWLIRVFSINTRMSHDIN